MSFFSHIKVKKFNPKTLELTDKEKSAYYKDIICGLVPNPFLIKFLRRIYYILRNDKKDIKRFKRITKKSKPIKKDYVDKIGGET